MPASMVKPGQEKYWQRAKEQAEKQGRGGDWAYVVGIFKKMTVNKSETADGEWWVETPSGLAGPYRHPADPQIPPKLLGLPVVRKPRGEELSKAVYGPSRTRYFIQVRQGGQVPDRRRLMELAEAYRPAKPPTVARLLDNGKPVYRLADVFSGLGLDPDAEASWRAMLGPVIESASNEVALRQAIYAVMREQKAPGELGGAVLERARKYRSEKMAKSVQVVTVDELRKAEPSGGTYYRRVKGKTGRWRYYYDQEKYESSTDAHLDGEGASKRAVRGKVVGMLEKAGKGGVALKDLKPLTKRYGSKLVGGVLNDARSKGELVYKGGKLRSQPQKGTKQ